MKKILVIEDNEEIRENTAELLELSGYKVITAENGKTGVELALKELPDLIVCDIMMPVLDGYGVLHMLSRIRETVHIPFIFLTAKSEKTDIRKGMEMGVDDYLTKPFDGIELLAAVEIRLQKAASLRQKITEDLNRVNEFINNAKQAGNIKLTSDEREVSNYYKKQTIYSEGQRPKAVYYVITGKVKTFRINEDGKELILAVNGPGDFFGYTAILEETNYTDNAQALEDTELMLIPKQDFLELITNNLQIAGQFIKIITKNILEKEETLLNLAYNSLRKRVAYGIIQLIDKYKRPDSEKTVLDISRENMANSIGVATESLIRTLGDFKSENLIDIQQGKIIVLDDKKLKNLRY